MTSTNSAQPHEVADGHGRAAARRFDQFDFRDMFSAVRSVALVGNAATVLGFENGALIDSYDMVVRFNRAQTAGLESRIGRRTDLLVANETNTLDRAPSPEKTLRPRCVLSFVLREADFDIAPFREWVGSDIPTLCSLPPDIVGFASGDRTRLLTHGTYTLYVLLNLLRIERLFVTGFTMFGIGPGGAQKYYGPHIRKMGTYHDLDREAPLFCAILASFRGELQVSCEVAALLDREGFRARISGNSVLGAPLTGMTLSEKLRFRLARLLLRWGTGLRSSVEHSNRAVFDTIPR